MRVAILGAPGTGKSALACDLLAASSCKNQWQWQHDAATQLALQQHLLQAPNQASRQQAIAAHVLQPVAADLILLSALEPGLHAAGAVAARQRQVEQSLRQALTGLQLPYATLYGSASARCQAASQAIAFALREPAPVPMPRSRWRWPCEKCSDPECEHRLFRDLVR